VLSLKRKKIILKFGNSKPGVSFKCIIGHMATDICYVDPEFNFLLFSMDSKLTCKDDKDKRYKENPKKERN